MLPISFHKNPLPFLPSFGIPDLPFGGIHSTVSVYPQIGDGATAGGHAADIATPQAAVLKSGMSDDKPELVYSTDRAVPRKEKRAAHDIQPGVHPSRQRVSVRLDRKGRGGKSVTVIEGLQMPQKEREALLKQLKTRFGTGGTVTGTGFEIQGDRRDPVMEALKKIGYSPKRSGG